MIERREREKERERKNGRRRDINREIKRKQRLITQNYRSKLLHKIIAQKWVNCRDTGVSKNTYNLYCDIQISNSFFVEKLAVKPRIKG